MSARDAARAALAAHDTLRAAHASEPPCNEDGMPYDPAAWIRWRESVSKPAYVAWDRAMDELDAALGEHVGRHPFTFRPLCEQLVSAA